jgi:hypothetical protein
MTLLRWIEWLIRMVTLAWLDLKASGVRRALVPYFLLQVLVLYICAAPVSQLWSGVVVPLVQLAFGEYYLHYPQSYIGLPVTGSAARVVVEVILAPLVVGWCAWALRYRLDHHRASAAELWRHAGRNYPALFVFGLLQVAVWLLAYGLPLAKLDSSSLLSYRSQWAVSLLGGALPMLILAPLFYTVPHLVIQESGLGAAMAESWRRFRKRWLMTLFLSAIPWMVGLPFTQALQRSSRLANLLRPELILVVMAVQVLVSVFAFFFVLDVAMRIYRNPRTEGQ